MNTPHPLLPPELHSVAADIASFSGINSDTADLVMLQAAGVASGNTIQARTPEMRDIGPSFNVGLVAPTLARPRGALIELLGHIPEQVKRAAHKKNILGIGAEALKASWEMLQKEVVELEEKLRTEQQSLADSSTLAGTMARMRSYGGGAAGSFASDNPYAIQLRIDEAHQRRAEIGTQIDNLAFQLGFGVLVDEPDWRELPKLAENSLDGTALAMCFANGPGGIASLSAKEREGCSRTLNAYRIQAPSVTVITCGTEAAYASVLSRKQSRESGILSEFLFIEAAAGAPDSTSLIPQTEALARWHELISKRWERRLALQNHACDLYQPEARGFAALIEFRKWVQREQSLSPDIAAHLAFLPDLPLRLAMVRASLTNAAGDLIIPHEYVEHAAGFLRRLGRRHRQLLDRLTVEQPEDEVIEQQIAGLVRKLQRRGPLTKRGLVRCMHNQDYGRLEPVLVEGVKRGNIIQAGDLFRASAVSASA